MPQQPPKPPHLAAVQDGPGKGEEEVVTLNLRPNELGVFLLTDHVTASIRTLAGQCRFLGMEDYAERAEILGVGMMGLRDRIVADSQTRVVIAQPGDVPKPH